MIYVVTALTLGLLLAAPIIVLLVYARREQRRAIRGTSQEWGALDDRIDIS